MDEGGFILDYRAPAGGALAETDRQVRVLEQILRADPDVQAFTRRTGSELGFAATAPNTGDFTVLLNPTGERDASVDQVSTGCGRRRRPGHRRSRWNSVQLMQDVIGDLAGAPEPVELKLFSRDERAGEQAAEAVAHAVETVPGLVDLFNGHPRATTPNSRVEPRSARSGAARAQHRRGCRPGPRRAVRRRGGLGAGARPAGADPGATARPRALRSAEVLNRIPIVGPSGWLPLGELGAVRDTGSASELPAGEPQTLRRGHRPHQRAESGAASWAMSGRRTRRVTLPAGVTLEIGGQYASQQSAFKPAARRAGHSRSARCCWCWCPSSGA